MSKLNDLEKEVRIVAREPRSVFFVDRKVNVCGIPFSAIENVGDRIAVMIRPFLQMAVRPVGAGESGADDGREEQIANINLASMSEAAPAIRDVAKILIQTGTDLSWDEAREYVWMNVVALAVEVLKYNLGPELRDFLSAEVREIAEVFGIKGIQSVTTPLNASSSEPDTASQKSD